MIEDNAERIAKQQLLVQAAERDIFLRRILPAKAHKITCGGRVIGSVAANPGLWSVVRGGRRIDSFIHEKNALDRIRALLQATAP